MGANVTAIKKRRRQARYNKRVKQRQKTTRAAAQKKK